MQFVIEWIITELLEILKTYEVQGAIQKSLF